MLGQQGSPDGDVPVLYVGQPQVHVATACIRLRRRKRSIQECGVAFILPVLAERLEVGGGW